MSTFLIAPNAFKGALTAQEAALAIQSGLSGRATVLFPIADGGDGSLALLINLVGAKLVQLKVRGPLGQPVQASFGWDEKSKTAIVELAEASGIRLVSKSQLNPLLATTYGTGQLLVESVKFGAHQILLTLGGSATVDGGIGLLDALGVRFYNGSRLITRPTPLDLEDITRYDASDAISLLRNTSITILADVANPLLGSLGATSVFGPQKGATPYQVTQLERGLENFAKVISNQEGTRVADVPHGGAAGGVAAVLYGFFRAKLVLGAPNILKLGDFETKLSQCDVVITGEGILDKQTLSGKGPAEVARLAKKYGKHVIAICGRSELGTAYPGYFDQIIEIADPSLSLEENMTHSSSLLERAGRKIFANL